MLIVGCRSHRQQSKKDDPNAQTSTPTPPQEGEKIKPLKLPPYTKTASPAGVSIVSGRIYDHNRELMIGATVVLKPKAGATLGAVTDMDGYFRIDRIPPGEYTITVSYVGYETQVYGPLKLDGAYEINFEMIEMPEIEIILLKPIIYLYPIDTTDVHVRLEYDGELIHTYPRYAQYGWDITACPDGTLFDHQGRSYYALFWEGSQNYADIPTSGTLVAGNESLNFLENALLAYGLTEREANEFILFWLPQMEKNAYNLVHFATDSYNEKVPLHVDPAPNTQLRIMMSVVPLELPIDFPTQPLPLQPIPRKGFTVVEWGGQIIAKELMDLKIP